METNCESYWYTIPPRRGGKQNGCAPFLCWWTRHFKTSHLQKCVMQKSIAWQPGEVRGKTRSTRARIGRTRIEKSATRAPTSRFPGTSRIAYFVMLLHHFLGAANHLFYHTSCSRHLFRCPETWLCIATHKCDQTGFKTPFWYRLFEALGWLQTIGGTSMHQITFSWHLSSTGCSKFQVLALSVDAGRHTLDFTDILIANAKCNIYSDILVPI